MKVSSCFVLLIGGRNFKSQGPGEVICLGDASLELWDASLRLALFSRLHKVGSFSHKMFRP